jgi:glycosyltransferase involved in cell wall biosynthesis
LAVVSLYPKKGEVYSSGTSGVASYTKNLITNLDRRVVVLADCQGKPRKYEEQNALIWRCFKPNSPRMWSQIVRSLKQFSQVKKVLIQFDFAMYGGMVTSGLVLPFLLWLKLAGFEVSIVSHHVILDVKRLSGHVGLGRGRAHKAKVKLYNLAFNVFYWILGKLTHKIIVLEKYLKQRLSRVVAETKIVVTPHAVDTSLRWTTKASARKRLGLNQRDWVVMQFGYLNWFKGSDLFAQKFAKISKILGKKVRFVLAGGESPTLKTKGFYHEYLGKLEQTVAQSKAVTITGYVPQEQLKDYFAAADLVVFPYRYFMCASGVLSLTFSYRRPFIVSKNLNHMLAGDLKQCLQEVGLSSKTISFSLQGEDLLRTTRQVLRNGTKAKLVRMAGLIQQKRSFATTAQKYDQILFASQPRSLSRSARSIRFAPLPSLVRTDQNR